MSVLKKPVQIALSVILFIGFAGCDRSNQDYSHIKDIPYSEWNQYASSLPVEQALDLHKEIMERSGHNPQMTIEGAFSERPQETYMSIVRRIRNGDTSRYYIGVLYEINRSPEFKICSQPDRKVVQDYLSGLTSYPEHQKYRPDFYDC